VFVHAPSPVITPTTDLSDIWFQLQLAGYLTLFKNINRTFYLFITKSCIRHFGEV